MPAALDRTVRRRVSVVRARSTSDVGAPADRGTGRRPAPTGSETRRRASTPGMRRRASAVQCRVAGGRSCSSGAAPRPSASPTRAAHHLVHQRLLAKAHLRLGRVHVDVDASGGISRNRCTSGLRSLIDADAVGVDDRVRDGPVLDDAAVDEDVLRSARRALLRQRRDEAVQPQAADLRCDRHQIVAIAVELIEPVAPAIATGGHCEHLAARRWSA